MKKKQTEQIPSRIETAEAVTDTLLKPRKKKLPGWAIFPILFVIILLFVLLSMLLKPAKPVTTLSVVTVQKGDVTEEYNTSGIVESAKTKTFYAPVNATVNTCNAIVGQAVNEGDLLISFDTSDLEKNNQQSQLNLEATIAGNESTREQTNQTLAKASQTQSNLEKQIASARQRINEKQDEVDQLEVLANQEAGKLQEDAYALSQQAIQLSSAIEAKNQEIQAKKAEIDGISAQLNTQNAELQKTQTQLQTAAKDDIETINRLTSQISSLYTQIAELKNTEITRRDEYDTLKTEGQKLSDELSSLGDLQSGSMGTSAQKLATARAELQSQQAALEQLENSSSAPGVSGLTEGQKKSMQLQENLAELSLLSAQELVELGKAGISAEFSGVISDVETAPGTAAMQGSPLFTLISNLDVNVIVEVPTNDFDKLKIGSKTSVKIGDFTYSGTLTSIDKIATTNAKGNPVIKAKVHIDNPDANIYIGVTAKINLTVSEAKSVLCLSNEIVNTGTDGDFVYVIRNGVVEKQLVTLGIASDSMVEIKSGLKEGEEVVTDVSGSLEEGMKAVGISTTSDK